MTEHSFPQKQSSNLSHSQLKWTAFSLAGHDWSCKCRLKRNQAGALQDGTMTIQTWNLSNLVSAIWWEGGEEIFCYFIHFCTNIKTTIATNPVQSFGSTMYLNWAQPVLVFINSLLLNCLVQHLILPCTFASSLFYFFYIIFYDKKNLKRKTIEHKAFNINILQYSAPNSLKACSPAQENRFFSLKSFKASERGI